MMNIVSFGGGTNSTAMIMGMYQRGIPIDLILFADTGGEKPHTYKHIDDMNEWLAEHGLPEITPLEYTDKDENRLTLEDDCLRYNAMPGVVYGRGDCAVRHKIGPQEKFCNNHQECKTIWKSGEKINKYVGYDAGEAQRINKNQHIYEADKKYSHHFPLYEWGWSREECIKVIQSEGLPLPGKSSCFYCPNNKKAEIQHLWENHPDLFDRAVAMEHNTRKTRRDGTPSSIIGLGRTWTWESYREAYFEEQEAKSRQFVLPGFEDVLGGCCCGQPCGCCDG